MATYTTRDVVTRRREFIVPAPQPWGAAVEELSKAVSAAAVFYREQHGLPDTVPLPGDIARVFPRDDELVIAVTVESAD